MMGCDELFFGGRGTWDYSRSLGLLMTWMRVVGRCFLV